MRVKREASLRRPAPPPQWESEDEDAVAAESPQAEVSGSAAGNLSLFIT